MLSRPRPRSSPRPQILWYLAVCCAVAMLCIAAGHSAPAGRGPYWDAQIYKAAVKAAEAHRDPYQLQLTLPYLHPPIFTLAATKLAAVLSGRVLWNLYLGLNFLAFLSLPAIVAGYCRTSWFSPVLALVLLLVQPPEMGLIALLSGNIATLLHAITWGTGLLGIRRNQWAPFYVAVLLAACIKPMFLTMLLLPVFTAARQIRWSALTVAATIGCYQLQQLLLPSMYREFLEASMHRAFVSDPGHMSLFRLLRSTLGSASPMSAYAANGIIAALLLLALISIRRQPLTDAARTLWPPMVLVSTALLNPRLMHYDADAAMLPAIFLIIQAAHRQLPSDRAKTLAALFAVAWITVLALHQPTAICLVLLASVAAAWLAIRKEAPRATQAEAGFAPISSGVQPMVDR